MLGAIYIVGVKKANMENSVNKQLNFVDLRFITTDDLIKELFSRFDHAIFSGMQERYSKWTNRYLNRYKGTKMVCIGLSKVIGDCILRILDAETKKIKKDLESKY